MGLKPQYLKPLLVPKKDLFAPAPQSSLIVHTANVFATGVAGAAKSKKKIYSYQHRKAAALATPRPPAPAPGTSRSNINMQLL